VRQICAGGFNKINFSLLSNDAPAEITVMENNGPQYKRLNPLKKNKNAPRNLSNYPLPIFGKVWRSSLGDCAIFDPLAGILGKFKLGDYGSLVYGAFV